jgi:hypothetical protein
MRVEGVYVALVDIRPLPATEPRLLDHLAPIPYRAMRRLDRGEAAA